MGDGKIEGCFLHIHVQDSIGFWLTKGPAHLGASCIGPSEEIWMCFLFFGFTVELVETEQESLWDNSGSSWLWAKSTSKLADPYHSHVYFTALFQTQLRYRLCTPWRGVVSLDPHSQSAETKRDVSQVCGNVYKINQMCTGVGSCCRRTLALAPFFFYHELWAWLYHFLDSSQTSGKS